MNLLHALVTLWLCTAPSLQSEGPIVQTTHGKVRGTQNDVAKTFMRIPFALPPTGSNRWQAPVPRTSWHPNILDVTEQPPGCPQTHCTDLTPPIACPKTTSEDCLYLSIWTPASATNESNLAVMVYIHGGNFYHMSGASPLFDGEVFVSKGNVILVNINYRLGALGFLVTGLGKEDATGNFGIYDQTLAMEWVKNNIKSFGGDPNKITLFGQSAGAQSIVQHLTSETSSALFQRAIIESTPSSLPYKSFSEAFVLGGLLAKELNCTVADLKCMKNKSAEAVAEAAFITRSKVASIKFLELFEPYGPYVDGNLVKGQPLDVYKKGDFPTKPLMIGSTTQETVLYIYGSFNKTVPLSEYLALLAGIRPDKVAQIVEEYPPSSTSGDQREALVVISTDLIFDCPTRYLTRSFLNRGQQDLWVYQWNHAFSFPGWGPIKFCEGRVCHGSEIVYVFATAYKGNFTFTQDEVTLSDDVISYWTNFAKTGDPNNAGESIPKQSGSVLKQKLFEHSGQLQMAIEDGGEPCNVRKTPRFNKVNGPLNWPKYNSEGGWSAMFFDTPKSKIVQDFRKDYCDFWDRIGYEWNV